MTILNPLATTAGDLALAALQEARVIGEGMSASSDQLNTAQTRLQWLLIEWQRKNQLVYHLVEYAVLSTGANNYTFGPGGDINTGEINGNFPISARPSAIRSAFLRQWAGGQGPGLSTFQLGFSSLGGNDAI